MGDEGAVIVTGAASGIGRAVALQLNEQGVPVIAVDIDAAGLTETVAKRVRLTDCARWSPTSLTQRK